MLNGRKLEKLSVLLGVAVLVSCTLSAPRVMAQLTGQVPLAGKAIPKYLDPLPHFAGVRFDATPYTTSANPLVVTMEEFQQPVLPSTFVYPAPFTGTYVWGYDVGGVGAHYPGFTVEANRGTPTFMKYVNNLPISPFLQQYLWVDQTLHWAMPQVTGNPLVDPYTGSPPAVAHLHGGEVLSDYDGGPDQWFTPDGIQGLGYRSAVPGLTNAAVYEYPNQQDGATLWFHDHTLGATRINVYAGLAAFYFLRDPTLERADLPGSAADSTVTEPSTGRTYKPEIEIAIQDRMFDTNGQLYFPNLGINPEHPFWIPEFLGDTIVVNGKTWPFLEVEPRRYRFRLVDGSNARFYELSLMDIISGLAGPPFWQIGSDGGLLDAPARIASPAKLLLGPGERADVIVDFSAFAGTTLRLKNSARAPYPKGAPPDAQTVGQIMEFRVGTVLSGGPDNSYNPSTLASPRVSAIAPLNPAAALVTRQLTLNEVMGMGGPLEVLVNNTKWAGHRMTGANTHVPIPGFTPDAQGNYLSELPRVGSTEVWQIINLTADSHPIHLHLVQFQLVSRRPFQASKYIKAYNAAFPGGGYDHMTMAPYPPGVYIPAYGPPLDYFTPNGDGALGGNPAVSGFLQGKARLPGANETGWKDTFIMHPGEVTTIVARWAQQDSGPYPFDATTGPGYVWHCHIVDHEDNEMMRPYIPVP